jgi:nitrate reductase assembly molybdenum cofactor insertion protein NarJ
MIKFNRDLKTDKLSEQFGIPAEKFEGVAEKWKETFDKIDSEIENMMTEVNDEGVEFDASRAMDIFCKAFDTQELQDIAIIQLLMRDVSRRAERAIKRKMLNESMARMFEEMKKGKSEDTDFEELL